MKKRINVYGWLLLVVGIGIGLVLASGFDFTTHSNAATGSSPITNPVQTPPSSPKVGSNVLQQFSMAFSNVAEKVTPSVVTIFTKKVIKARPGPKVEDPFEQFFGDDFYRRFFGIPRQEGDIVQHGLGSGVIVNSDGIILTNNHVVQKTDELKVRLNDGREFEAEVKGTDPATDLAVIKIKASNLPTLPIGDSDALRVGEWVLAIGSPLSPNLAHTVTAGIVSAKGRSGVGLSNYEDYIQTDAAINPGNSGGALVNLKGELVGINSAIATRTGGNMGIGFAIPSKLAKKVMNDILKNGKVIRGWIGVRIQDVNPPLAKSYGLEKPEGAIVSSVTPGSPGRKAGLKEGDVVLTLNGKKVKNSSDLALRVSSTDPGTTVTLGIYRDGKKKSVKVKLGQMPANQNKLAAKAVEPAANLGLSVENITPDIRRELDLDRSIKGVIISRVRRGSLADDEGLRRGDIILKVNGKTVSNVEKFRKEMNSLKPGDSVAFFLYRNGEKFFAGFTIPKS